MRPADYRQAYLQDLERYPPPLTTASDTAPEVDEDLVSSARCYGPAQAAISIALARSSEVMDILARTLPESPHRMDTAAFEGWLLQHHELEMQVQRLENELQTRRAASESELQRVQEASEAELQRVRQVLDGEIAALRQALQAVQQTLEERIRFIERIMRSPSMRIGRLLTAPLRATRYSMTRLRQGLRDRLRQWARRWPVLLREGKLKNVGRHLLDAADRDDPTFEDWVQQYGHLDPARRAAMERHWPQLQHQPTISLLVPIHNTDPDLLRQTVQSVLDQVYPHWQLVLVDDASSASATRTAIDACETLDPRVQVIRRTRNGHISAASNTALQAAKGDWVGLLDHDDLLAPDALYWVLEEINANPQCRLIYSDEDKLGVDGRRRDPHFKPDWNPDLLRSQNYINHFCVYHRDRLEQTGGFRTGFEGAQDYDLVLRFTEGLAAEQIRHIPRILYHWRAVASSTANAGSAKPYAVEAARRALREHLDRSGHADAEVLPAPGFEGVWWRVRYGLPEHPPRVSILMPTRNGLQLLLNSVSGVLERTDYPDYELIVIDNGSDDPATLQYLDFIAERHGVKVIRDDRPFNYSQLNNGAAAHATGAVLVLMNNDIEVIQRDWLREMVSHVLRPEIGLVGARLWFPNDTLQHAGCVLGIGGVAGHAFLHEPRGVDGYFGRAALIQNYSAVTAACVALRKTVFEQVGGLNEQELRIAFNDVDLSLRVLEAGYRNLWTPYAELVHAESVSRGYEDTPEKQARFRKEIEYMRRRWAHLLDQDPAYNPNLSLVDSHYRLASRPRLPPDPWIR